MLTAVAQPLPAPRLLTQPTTLAPLQQLAPLHPLNPLVQQVGFHIAFVADFLTTGAVLFAREFAIPGALIQDIHSGIPVPVAVGRALQTFAQIELEAGRELVGFAAEYVSFQLNFLANLVTTPVAAVGELATSFLAGLTPAAAHRRPSHPADRRPCSRQGSQRRMGRPQRQLPTKSRRRAVRRRDDSARR